MQKAILYATVTPSYKSLSCKNHVLYTWLFLRWFYFCEYRESDLAKIPTSIYVYL